MKASVEVRYRDSQTNGERLRDIPAVASVTMGSLLDFAPVYTFTYTLRTNIRHILPRPPSFLAEPKQHTNKTKAAARLIYSRFEIIKQTFGVGSSTLSLPYHNHTIPNHNTHIRPHTTPYLAEIASSSSECQRATWPLLPAVARRKAVDASYWRENNRPTAIAFDATWC